MTAAPETRLALYRCDVDDPPDLPAGLGPPATGWEGPDDAGDGGPLVVAAGFRAGEPPQWRFLRLHAPAVVHVPDFSLKDPRTRVTYPYWASGTSKAAVTSLPRSGTAVAPGAGTPAATPVLQRLGVLVTEAGAAGLRSRWARESAALAGDLAGRGVVEVPGILHPLHVAALRDYFAGLVASGDLPLGDGQSAHRHVGYNDPVAAYFHQELAGLVGELAGEVVRPSYSYLVRYEGADGLAPHTDREQCDYTLNVLLDFDPDPGPRSPWPLQFATDGGPVDIHQLVGSGIVFRGCRIPHGRPPQPAGTRSMSLLLHYVGPGFAGELG